MDAWVVESETKLHPAVNVDIRIHRLVLVDLSALSIPIQLPSTHNCLPIHDRRPFYRRYFAHAYHLNPSSSSNGVMPLREGRVA
jgi:hypothetical protein